ncbi:MAG: type II toxin-antitoxin system VapC family toxin [Ruminiclostridium sp.]|nr:type II toxin-antitoxin system VapC family toxin [Ruminiclostridium sp.]
MQTSALIDTNVLIDHLRGRPSATDFLKSLIIDETKLVCSVITRVELLAGMRPGEDKGIRSLLQILDEAPVDIAVAELAGKYMNLYMKSHGLTAGDAILAATAKKLDITLYTINVKHFPMADIRVEAPY